MKRLFSIMAFAAAMLFCLPGHAQLVEGPRGSDDFQIGIAGYTYRSFNIDQTLEYLKSLGVKYLSIKDFFENIKISFAFCS